MAAPPARLRRVNVVIIGHTGTGKSSLGTLILPPDTDGFEVSHSSDVSCTKNCTGRMFDHHGASVTVAVVDTIGIGSTGFDQSTVFNQIAKIVKEFPEGLHAILFVFDGPFRASERAAYFLLTQVLFPGCESHLYLIRNKFRFCQDTTRCQEDIETLSKDTLTRSILSRTPPDHIIHVDSNPISAIFAGYTRETLLSLIGRLDGTYSSPAYQEIYKRIEDTNGEEAGKTIQRLTERSIAKMSDLELLVGLGLGESAKDFKATFEKCQIM